MCVCVCVCVRARVMFLPCCDIWCMHVVCLPLGVYLRMHIRECVFVCARAYVCMHVYACASESVGMSVCWVTVMAESLDFQHSWTAPLVVMLRQKSRRI